MRYNDSKNNQLLLNVGHMLHDAIAPQIFISRMQMEVFINSFEEDELSEKQQKVLHTVWGNLDLGYKNIRKVISGIHEGNIGDEDLLFPTIEESISSFKILLPIKIDSELDYLDEVTNKRLGVCLFELLTNAYKYTKLSDVDICVSLRHDNNMVCMTVAVIGESGYCDNTKEGGGKGLYLMAQRVSQWQGVQTITTDGTAYRCVEIKLPMPVVSICNIGFLENE